MALIVFDLILTASPERLHLLDHGRLLLYGSDLISQGGRHTRPA